MIEYIFDTRSAPFRLGSESPDLVSIEVKDSHRSREYKDNTGKTEPEQRLVTNREPSGTCLSDTNLGILSFKSSVETTTPSFLKGGIVNWNKNIHQHPENLDSMRHNPAKTPSSSMHQYNGQEISCEQRQSSTDLIPPFYHSQHNEFIQSDMPSILTNHTIQSTSNPNTRCSQNYSTSNPHMYL